MTSHRRRTAPRWARLPEWATLTVWAATLLMVAASVARAFTYPPLGSKDEPAHFDYAVLLWHGRFPVFEDGITYGTTFGVDAPVQWVSQHPPLYYLVLAPIVGPLYDGDHALIAVLAGRMVSAVMAGLVVLATAWAASRCFPGHRRLPGGAAVVTALAGMLVQQGSSIYNDVLFVVFCALACGVAGAALRTGVGPRLLVGAALVGAGGMATRLTFFVWLIAICAAVLLAPTVRLGRLPAVWARLLAAATPGLAALVAAGWWYVHNKQTTGNFSGRHAQWGLENAGRVERPFLDITFDPEFYKSLFGVYRGIMKPADPTQWVLMLGPIVLAVVVGLVALVRRTRSGTALPVRRVAPLGWMPAWLSVGLVVAMFVAVTLLLVVVEIQYVTGGGAPITRYALTVLPPIAIAMSAGLTGWRWTSGVFTALWIALAVVPYLTLVDLHVVGIVPHAARVVQVMFVVSLVAMVGCVVGAFLDARRRPEAPAAVSGPGAPTTDGTAADGTVADGTVADDTGTGTPAAEDRADGRGDTALLDRTD